MTSVSIEPYRVQFLLADCHLSPRLLRGLRLAFDNTQIRTTTRRLPLYMVYGIVNGMELRIDKSGRIVVPKPLRERLGFKPDTELEAVEQPDGVLLKRVERRPSMTMIDDLWVHQGIPQPGANWERILEDVREERIESVLKA
jgi:AbrB family looped-hinge helix DNA binding protein